jgi:hypothetical protein
VGTTGDGKTVLAEHLYAMRRYVVVIATKAKDDSLDAYGKDFHRIKKWPPRFDQKKVLFWKKPGELGDFSEQREDIKNVLNDVYKRGGYTIGLDDVAYISSTLKLEGEIRMLCTQARSEDISLVMNMQRPYRVPLECTNQSSHILIFGLKDDKDIDRVAESSGVRRLDVREAVGQLNKYDFAWLKKSSEPILVRNREG